MGAKNRNTGPGGPPSFQKTVLKQIYTKTYCNCQNLKKNRKIFKAAMEKQPVTYKENAIRLLEGISTENLQARREWNNIFIILKGINF